MFFIPQLNSHMMRNLNVKHFYVTNTFFRKIITDLLFLIKIHRNADFTNFELIKKSKNALNRFCGFGLESLVNHI